jgi:Tfp pilus assembly protein PilF
MQISELLGFKTRPGLEPDSKKRRCRVVNKTQFSENYTQGLMSPRAKARRNDPCPCGSGKKYKKCHGVSGKREASSEPSAHQALGQQAAVTSRSKTLTIVICTLLALSVLVIYAQTANFGYVAYDDDQYVYQNTWVKAGLTPSNVGWAFTTFFYANWHPLTWISYMLDFNLFGSNPGAQHLVNVALHLASTLLLFLALVRMTGQPWRCAVVAAIFAVHPLHVESVAWISERKDVLSTFFEMLTLLLYVRYTEKRSVGNYLAVAVAFGFSLLAKPMAVTFPFVLLLLDFWPLRRLAWPLQPAVLRRLFLEKTPLLAMAAVTSVLTFLAQRGYGAVASLSHLPLAERVANAAIAYVAYIGKTFWPMDLAVLYPVQQPVIGNALIAVLILAAITVAASKWVRQRPYLAVGWLWYLGMLVPVIGLVQVGTQLMADRYTYVPMVGLSIAVVWTIADLVKNRPALRIAATAATIPMLAILAGAAYQQTAYWKTSRTLFEHTLAITKDNRIIQNNLGVVLADEGNSAEAVKLFHSALAIDPDYAEAQSNLGHELLKSGQSDQAQASLTKALDLNPNLVRAHADMGVLLASRGEFEEARHHLERSLNLAPGDAENESNLCFVLTHLGRFDEAIAHCNTALLINPGMSNARFNLDNAKAAQQHHDH